MSNLSILVEGDKIAFNSKSAFTKFKDFLRGNGSLDNASKFVKPEYKILLTDKTEKEVKYKIVSKDYVEETKVDVKQKKDMLKAKLKLLADTRTNINVRHLSLNKDVVPKEISDEYKKLMKISKVPVPEPIEILKNPEQYKSLVMGVLQNGITANLPNNHPYKNYFKLLAKQLGIGADYKMPEMPNMDNMLKNISPSILNTIADKDADTEEN
jgi:hypothetical protein